MGVTAVSGPVYYTPGDLSNTADKLSKTNAEATKDGKLDRAVDFCDLQLAPLSVGSGKGDAATLDEQKTVHTIARRVLTRDVNRYPDFNKAGEPAKKLIVESLAAKISEKHRGLVLRDVLTTWQSLSYRSYCYVRDLSYNPNTPMISNVKLNLTEEEVGQVIDTVLKNQPKTEAAPAAKPVITDISPEEVTAGGKKPVQVTITGSNFEGAELVITDDNCRKAASKHSAEASNVTFTLTPKTLAGAPKDCSFTVKTKAGQDTKTIAVVKAKPEERVKPDKPSGERNCTFAEKMDGKLSAASSGEKLDGKVCKVIGGKVSWVNQ
jgi:hypothetical protein